nr:DNA mismatch repair endonuclease MutL [Roseomonas acroporae]
MSNHLPDSIPLPRAAAAIRLLPETTANRIAAGEVVERPAAAVKELVENALDAGARRIAVTLEEGGIGRILVEDDGIGMGAEDLALCVERHATSKLPEEAALFRIATLGFRGEALPSIGAVARLTITSRPNPAAGMAAGEGGGREAGDADFGSAEFGGGDSGEAHAIAVEGGRRDAVRPAAGAPGTRVEVRDLFFATPARRKFLRQPRTEADHAVEAVRRLALAWPEVAFRVESDGREVLALAASDRAGRLHDLLGPAFAAHAVPVLAEGGAVRLEGLAALPAHTRATAAEQHLVVNRRPVRDPLLRAALRVAYRDLIAAGRHPVAALFLSLPPEAVDVNVHPMKTELRFRDSGAVRGALIAALRRALAVGAGATLPGAAPAGGRAGEAGSAAVGGVVGGGPAVLVSADGEWRLAAGGSGAGNEPSGGTGAARADSGMAAAWPPPAMPGGPASPPGFAETASGFAAPAVQSRLPLGFARRPLPVAPPPVAKPWPADGAGPDAVATVGPPDGTPAPAADPSSDHPLGRPLAQLFDTYLLAEAPDGALVLVDQHAAHERLTHERLRAQLVEGGVRTQPLLLPAVVEMGAADAGRLLARADDLVRLGLEIEGFGPGAVLVRAVPALLGNPDPAPILRDMADEIAEWEEATALDRRLDAAVARLACHGSIRAGRRLVPAEMDALLRAMEATPRAATCSHGRPTFLRFGRAEFERLFGRS